MVKMILRSIAPRTPSLPSGECPSPAARRIACGPTAPVESPVTSPAFTAMVNINSLRRIRHRIYDGGVHSTSPRPTKPITRIARRKAGDFPTSLQNDAFDAPAEAARLRAQTRTTRKRRHGSSRLDRYTHELLALRDEGSITAELQRWLRDRRIRVHHSTVARWLRRHGAD